ncbi:hypothetical protein GCM10017567_73460 [Amycolatopsis bullii]|uniref:Uncharacterized protein n=1 Tax=Amycolatopsis bullii TaxID=941987 RepID=A0ABQ3KR51_9PSEU|nr:hypothetical protein GCM10017567_73460 [Amycolatopsis bullii]
MQHGGSRGPAIRPIRTCIPTDAGEAIHKQSSAPRLFDLITDAEAKCLFRVGARPAGKIVSAILSGLLLSLAPGIAAADAPQWRLRRDIANC